MKSKPVQKWLLKVASKEANPYHQAELIYQALDSGTEDEDRKLFVYYILKYLSEMNEAQKKIDDAVKKMVVMNENE